MANHHGAAALLIASLLVAAVTLADARLSVQHRDTLGGYVTVGAVRLPVSPELVCTMVYGVQERHETCFALAQAAGLTLKRFLSFNPNINCKKVFIGQWVCLAAHLE
ncbi:hypothetical protein BAE44_0013760 [Dichanthelium oligosanthes]|uniref:LysM domain-containing protein n=1 Tax=Dichanthelium oligosanthes TaxID=888268 RepID=A0A1E5VJB7_9POAL|nr:hypothetical protein BAE44_0013760 [Dichanthelium oligosanthes]